jgi:hypothetical protein
MTSSVTMARLNILEQGKNPVKAQISTSALWSARSPPEHAGHFSSLPIFGGGYLKIPIERRSQRRTCRCVGQLAEECEDLGS